MTPTAFLSARCPQCHTSLPCVDTPLVASPTIAAASPTAAVLTWLIDAIHGRWPSAQDALACAIEKGVIRHE